VDERSARWEKRFDLPIIVGALATIPLLILDQSSVGQPWSTIAAVGDWIVWLVFAVDLVVMLAVVPSKRTYLREHPVDLIVVVLTPPFLSAGLQSIRVVRVLRLLRLLRFAPLIRRFFSLEGLRYAAVLSGVALFGGAEAFAAAEKVSYGTGIYWALQTMTTVGYGDVPPKTSLGRVVACVLMLLGIGFFALMTGAVAERFLAVEIEEVVEELEADETELLEQIQQLSQQVQRLEASVRKRAGSRSI
jgi:voltage-gated potassium channel